MSVQERIARIDVEKAIGMFVIYIGYMGTKGCCVMDNQTS